MRRRPEAALVSVPHTCFCRVKKFNFVLYLYVSDLWVFPDKAAHDVTQFLQVALLREVVVVAVAPVDVFLNLRQIQADWINRFRLQTNIYD